ncbi:LAMI_0A06128g1_1 [Lachancea mirantina]|uniref:LAMI_0A06128g1_1 n=1 Tax=Lachancea mirantina TaxID=1230905 RepID=A0A1G4IQG5_9SACH|nr:LAMI_0A06128g1_1 [Lachancea mirantina]
MVFMRSVRLLIKRFCFKISQWSIQSPSICITLAALIFFTLSFPVLFRTSDFGVFAGGYFGKVDVRPVVENETDFFSLAQIYYRRHDDQNVLRRDFLLKALALEKHMLSNVSNNVVDFVESPFRLWNNSLPTVQADASPLRTINLNSRQLSRGVFRNVLKVNTYVSAAKALVTSLITRETNSKILLEALSDNAARLNAISNVTHFSILSATGNGEQATTNDLVEISVTGVNKADYAILAFLFIFVTYTFVRSEFERWPLKFRATIAIATSVGLLFSIASSLTLTHLAFKNCGENVPLIFMVVPVLVYALDGEARFLRNTAWLFSHDVEDSLEIRSLEFLQRTYLKATFTACYESLKGITAMHFVCCLMFPFNGKASMFIVSATLIHFILRFTFGTALISLDINRLRNHDFYVDRGVPTLDTNKSSPHNRLTHQIKQYLFSRSSFSKYRILWVLFYQILLNWRFRIARSASISFFSSSLNGASATFPGFELRSISLQFLQRYGSGKYLITRLSSGQFQAIDYDNEAIAKLASHPQFANDLAAVYSYHFDSLFFFHFVVALVLFAASSLLMVRVILPRLESDAPFQKMSHKSKEDDNGVFVKSTKQRDPGTFSVKELSAAGHSLDIIKICASHCPFIVSASMDRGLKVWSPLLTPVPVPTDIPLPRSLWPLSKIEMSDDGSHIAFFNQTGSVTCWSRKQMAFIWSIQIEDLAPGPLECHFRLKTIPAFMKRKAMLKRSQKEADADSHARPTLSRRSSVTSVLSMQSVGAGPGLVLKSVTVPYGDNLALPDEDEVNELVVVSSQGTIFCIDIQGNVERYSISNSEQKQRLITCKRLQTPRVNDRLVSHDEYGNLFISTVVNNKWKTRKVNIMRGAFNKGRKLMTPASLNAQENASLERNDAKDTPIIADEFCLSVVPFVGMILITNKNKAELVDAQTGTSIKFFQLSDPVLTSLKVFHDEPTHCRFCGYASVGSFSIAYENANKELNLHTFQLESRTKNSICLRVDRDPREIRCLGMDSVVEKRYTIPDTENWNVTDSNFLIGVRRKANKEVTEVCTSSASTLLTHSSMTEAIKRTNIPPKKVQTKTSVDYCISEIWEGWTMSVNGTVTSHSIPFGENGLLTTKIGPAEKFGTKAIVVAFGNIMKVLFLGHEDLLMNFEGDTNEDETGLKFVNKRRTRIASRKYPND